MHTLTAAKGSTELIIAPIETYVKSINFGAFSSQKGDVLGTKPMLFKQFDIISFKCRCFH